MTTERTEQEEEALADAIENKIAAAAGVAPRDLRVTFCVSRVSLTKLDKVAFRGVCRLVMDRTFYGSGWGKCETHLLRDPTWIELAVMVHHGIAIMGDPDHHFLEGVEHDKTVDGVKLLIPNMGS